MICALLSVLLLIGGVTEARADAVKEAGDVIQILLPIVGFGSTFVAGSPDGGYWDKEGTWQATLSMGGALLTMRAWKVVAQKLRPSGGARSSFPSGHTCAAFSGAAFIERRYGWKPGVPAYASALFVAYSRVDADAHFADDVTAGASIAMLFAWRFVTPRPSGVDIAPMITDDGSVGASISMPLGGDDREAGSVSERGWSIRPGASTKCVYAGGTRPSPGSAGILPAAPASCSSI